MGFLGKCSVRGLRTIPQISRGELGTVKGKPKRFWLQIAVEIAVKSFSINNQPRPEAVVLGRPPEGADYVRLPPLGAWSWSGPSFLPGTGRGFSVDDDFQAYPLSCESLPKP